MLTESSIINSQNYVRQQKAKEIYVFAPKDFVLPDAMTH